MIYEIIIVLAILIIFIILARKMPSTREAVKTNKIVSEPMKPSVKVETIKPLKNLIDQAESFFQQGKFTEAEELYIKLAAQDPEDSKIYNRLGIIYLEQKNYIDAKDAFKEALKHGGGKAARYYNLALACLGLQELRSALEAIEESVKLDKENIKYQQLYEQIKKRMRKFKPLRSRTKE